MRRWMAFILLAGIVLAVVACGDRAATYTLVGSVTLTPGDDEYWWTTVCQGSGGYSDLKDGAQVVVKDDQSNLVGVGSFAQGTSTQRVPYGHPIEVGAQHIHFAACQFSFSVSGLPRRPFYVVSAGQRGGGPNLHLRRAAIQRLEHSSVHRRRLITSLRSAMTHRLSAPLPPGAAPVGLGTRRERRTTEFFGLPSGWPHFDQDGQ